MATCVDILNLIAARRARRPVLAYLGLDALFSRLAACAHPEEALRTEDRIWDAWMHHQHRQVERDLQLATEDIAAKRYDIAETRLTILLRRVPDFAEAWHKRATLYYMLGRDIDCLHDIRRTLELEPRHFAAMLHFAEILLCREATEDARFTFFNVLALHPHHSRARQVLASAR